MQAPIRTPSPPAERGGRTSLPEHATDRAGVERAAERAGFLPVVATLPAGRDTVLTRELPGGVDLSGGQWQRLALARALFATAHGARVLVLDEPTAAPTASLDAHAEHALFTRYAGAARWGAAATGAVTVLVSHRFSTVRTADLVVVLDGGRVEETGTHAELIAAGGRYAELFGLQAAGYR